MKRSHVALLTLAVGLAFLLMLLYVLVGHSVPSLAAPQLVSAASGLSRGDAEFLYQGTITCTLATTTTDALHGNDSFSTAAILANYASLALVTGNKGEEQQPEEDYFRLDNATPNFTYQVEAIPDGVGNYNLGITVYDAGQTQIMVDSNPLDGNSAKVKLVVTGAASYYFVVSQISNQCSGGTYHLAVSIPTSPTGADDYEPNNSKDTAYKLPVSASASATDCNFYPLPDEDWFAFYVKSGRYYRASTSNLSNVDTYVEVYSQDSQRITSDNDSGGGFSSKAEWEASYDGYYYVRVTNLVSSTSQDTYDLTVAEISAPPTSTPEPTEPGPTAIPGMDQFEPNYDFVHAATLATNVTYDANFIPWGGGTEDNDFYKIWIKPGLHFICETSDLAPGVDTNMIVYDGNQNALGGNDDVALGDYRSRFAYFSTYEGWLYILVGHGGRLPLTEVKDSSYKIRCDMQVPGQATPTSTPEPGEVPPPPTPTKTPEPPTPPPPEELTVRLLTTPTPPAATIPVPRFVPIRLLVYYDARDDHQPGAGEGVAGISAQAYEAATNQLLAQGFTDEQGYLEFTVAARGPVRVTVPFFGFSQLVAGEGASIYLRVPPQPLPGGAP